MLESECHPLGAIAFAEARGQSGPQALEKIVLKKFAKVNDISAREADPPDLPKSPEVSEEKLIFNPGTCSI